MADLYFAAALVGLSEDDQESVAIAVAVLEEQAPGLGHIRVLFAFDPARVAILLLGGDKRDRWTAWYEQAIPKPKGGTTNIWLNCETKENGHEPQGKEVQ